MFKVGDRVKFNIYLKTYKDPEYFDVIGTIVKLGTEKWDSEYIINIDPNTTLPKEAEEKLHAVYGLKGWHRDGKNISLAESLEEFEGEYTFEI